MFNFYRYFEQKNAENGCRKQLRLGQFQKSFASHMPLSLVANWDQFEGIQHWLRGKSRSLWFSIKIVMEFYSVADEIY